MNNIVSLLVDPKTNSYHFFSDNIIIDSNLILFELPSIYFSEVNKFSYC
jgi:hypothetical protein